METDVCKPELTAAEVGDVADALIGLAVHAFCTDVGGADVWVCGLLGDKADESTKRRIHAAFQRRVDRMREKAETLKL